MSEAKRYAQQVRDGVVLSTENLARFIEDQDARLAAVEAELKEAKESLRVAARDAEYQRLAREIGEPEAYRRVYRTPALPVPARTDETTR